MPNRNDIVMKYLSLRTLAVLLIFPLVLSITAFKSFEPGEGKASTLVTAVAGDSLAVSDDDDEIVSVPEPSTLLLFGASAAFLVLFLRGKNAASKLEELQKQKEVDVVK